MSRVPRFSPSLVLFFIVDIFFVLAIAGGLAISLVHVFFVVLIVTDCRLRRTLGSFRPRTELFLLRLFLLLARRPRPLFSP